MASSSYLSGRKVYGRPQAMLWSDSPGTISGSVVVPTGYEKLSNTTGLTASQIADSFLITSDHNRSEIQISNERIEQRKRMINGTMRSYHTADKLTISVSWNNLPSRSFRSRPNFNQTTGNSTLEDKNANRNADGTGFDLEDQYTVDGGAGGVELLDWYETHTGPFWVYLAYDKYNNYGSGPAAYGFLQNYSQIVQMYISGFDYSVVKRGTNNHDLWNVSITLEEV